MSVLSPPAGVQRRLLDTSRGPVVASYACPPAECDTDVAVVMVPGYGSSKEDFWTLLPRAAQAGYHAWSYDQLGQYETPGPDDPEAYTIDLLAQDLRTVVAQVGGDAPVHLLGHCLAGFVARASTLAEPAAVRSLTLLGCGPSMREPRHRTILADLDAQLDVGVFDLMWPAIERLVPEHDTLTRDLCHAKLQAASRGFMQGMARSLATEPDRCAELRASRVPVLVMHGERDRRLWSRDAFADMAAELGAELAVIDRASHRPHLRQSEQTLELLLGFWSRTCGEGAAQPRVGP